MIRLGDIAFWRHQWSDPAIVDPPAGDTTHERADDVNPETASWSWNRDVPETRGPGDQPWSEVPGRIPAGLGNRREKTDQDRHCEADEERQHARRRRRAIAWVGQGENDEHQDRRAERLHQGCFEGRG